MEDFQEQEYEFLRRLEEERIGRRKLLKRGLAAGGRPHRHRAARSRPRGAAEGARGPAAPRHQEEPGRSSSRRRRRKGSLNVIALPPDWANYGEIISTFSKKYGIPITSDNPNGSSAQENQAIVSLKGDPRAPTSSTSTRRSRSPAPSRACTPGTTSANYATVPRAMKDTRGLWTGDYYGSVTIGYNANLVKTPPKSFADLLKPIYKNQVALNGSPLTSGSAIAGVFAAALANGGSLSATSAPGSTGSRRPRRPATTSRWRRPRRRSRPARRRSRSTGTTTTSRT